MLVLAFSAASTLVLVVLLLLAVYDVVTRRTQPDLPDGPERIEVVEDGDEPEGLAVYPATAYVTISAPTPTVTVGP